MAYVRKEERYKKLKEKFLEKNKERWKEYELLGEYCNKDTKTLFRHSCGNEFLMTPHNFSAGHSCPICANEKRKKNIQKSKGNKFLDYINNSSEYELVGEYINQQTRVDILHKICGNVTAYQPTCFYFKNNKDKCLCKVCSFKNRAEKLRLTLEDANKRLSKVNPEYEFLEYTNAMSEAKIKHKSCGEIFTGKAYYFLAGNGHCKKCTTHISKPEREVYEWVSQFDNTGIQSYKEVYGVPEIDIYFPEQKVGVQFNGHYWHGGLKKDKKWHSNQSKSCRVQGIRLIHVWDYEWENPRQRKVLENIILGALHKLPERYYARKCEVKKYTPDSVRWQELNEFFEANNIQGNRGGRLVYTLEINGEILMAYKFGVPSGGLAKKKYEWEMVRGACKAGVQVIGGATKLWKHFINEMKPKSVVYYIDFNYFDGCSVEKLGGKYIGHTDSYKNYWVKEKCVKNRSPREHERIKELEKQGLVYKIWNAGVLKYEFIF